MVRIISFGKLKHKALVLLEQEYVTRMQRFSDLRFQDVIFQDSNQKQIQKKILEVKEKYKDADVFLLDEYGSTHTTEEFFSILRPAFDEGKELIFCIGGPDGFSDEFKREFKRISLSKMTFTHEMAKVLLLEQVYRSATIKHNIPYHKE